ncbi:MAG: class I SAM-dependent methyltransferase [Acidobacteriota bacterium]
MIAEPGSGTGLLTKLFLKNGNQVFGVEPNAEMREAGERELATYPGFVSVDATAEATTLANNSVDFVVAGQAFHWFDRDAVQVEFSRILKPAGWVVLIWNGYYYESSPLMAAYQELVLRHGTDYQEVSRELDHTDIESFFAPGSCRLAQFNFQQTFDYQGLEGRLLSSSFVPETGHPNYAPMLRDLRDIFDANQVDGKVTFEYQTELYYGQLASPAAVSPPS